MNRLIAPAAIFATATVTALAWSQTPSPAPNINTKIYFTMPLEKDDTRIVRLESATFPPHEGNDFHRHSGEQWTAIQEGEIALTIRGQAPRTLRPGDSAYIPRHRPPQPESHRQTGAPPPTQHHGQGQAMGRTGGWNRLENREP